jgi:hypothetical protein
MAASLCYFRTHRMKANLKRGFNRLFVVLTAAWVLYCLFVYPMQKRQRAQKAYEAVLRDCYEHELGKGQEFRECLTYAELKSGVDIWTLKAYYTRESWFLALIATVVPLLVYGFCRGLAALSLWVGRGFTSHS